MVVGPGLGDDPATLEAAALVIKQVRAADIPLVIDADGIRVVANQPELILGYAKCVITPNAPEFQLLCEARIAARSQSISPVASFILICAFAFCMAVLPSIQLDARPDTAVMMLPIISIDSLVTSQQENI